MVTFGVAVKLVDHRLSAFPVDLMGPFSSTLDLNRLDELGPTTQQSGQLRVVIG